MDFLFAFQMQYGIILEMNKYLEFLVKLTIIYFFNGCSENSSFNLRLKYFVPQTFMCLNFFF